MAIRNKKLGIALSGGGVRGFFHAGFLQAMRDRDVQVDLISGVSAGAIAASFYVVDADYEVAINRFPTHLRSLFFEPTLLWRAKFNPTNILREYLREFIGMHRIESLDIPLRINAVNISNGNSEVFTSGSLLEAVMASCAIPGVFNSFHENGNIYIDGGLVMNLPVSVIRDQVDLLIAVNVLPFQERSYRRLPGRRRLLQRSMDIFHKQNNIREEKLADILVSPHSLSRFPTYDMSNKQILFDLGYDAGMELGFDESQDVASAD